MPAKRKASSETSTATIGFEAKLWLTADKMRNNMDAPDWSGATKTAAGSPKGGRGVAHPYFLTRFASAEGKNGGPAKCEVRSARVEVKTSQPFFVRNSSFGISLRPEHADTFRSDLHPDLRADYVLANPPFNDSDWFRKDDDKRWQFCVPPKGNANFAWVQHFIHLLAPQGMASFALANGSMSSNQSGDCPARSASSKPKP